MHVYISTTVLANDIHGDVLCQVKQVLMYKAECVYVCLSEWVKFVCYR